MTSNIETTTESIKRLLKEAKQIQNAARSVQSSEPSTASDSEVENLHETYNEWYAESLSVLPTDLLEQFAKQFEGSFWDQKIRHFLDGPTKRNALWSAEMSASPNMFPISFFQNPVDRCFLAPFRQQQGFLLQAEKRLVTKIGETRHSDSSRMVPTVFIGHGRSHLYKHIESFIEKRLNLQTITFESSPRAGTTNVEVLKECLSQANFAVLVVTAEDQTTDGKIRARQNVVHEIGLFQGRLGFERVALLRQSGTEEFSNLAGLQELRFAGENIKSVYEDLRSVVEREQLIENSTRSNTK